MMIRKLAIVCLAGLGLFTASCLPFGFKPLSPEPKLEVDRDQHDFGSIPPTEPVQTVFKVANRGGKTLEISRIQTSCGCTAGMMDSQTIKPGETSRLKVTYDPRGKSGRQGKTLWLYTNDPQNTQKQLSIIADVTVGTPMQQPVIPPADNAVPVSGPGKK